MSRVRTRSLERSINEKRSQIASLRAEIEDLSDYLDVLEARAHDRGKRRLSHDEVKKRYGLTSSRSRNGRRAVA